MYLSQQPNLKMFLSRIKAKKKKKDKGRRGGKETENIGGRNLIQVME